MMDTMSKINSDQLCEKGLCENRGLKMGGGAHSSIGRVQNNVKLVYEVSKYPHCTAILTLLLDDLCSLPKVYN